MEQLFPFILLALAAVLLFVMPARQRKRIADKQKALQESLTVGTPVMTTSGLHGTVTRLTDTTVDLEIAPGTVVTFVRQAILEIRRPVGDPSGTTGDDAPGAAGGRPAAGTL